MTINSNIVALKIPWTEERGGLQSVGLWKSGTRLGKQTRATHTQLQPVSFLKEDFLSASQLVRGCSELGRRWAPSLLRSVPWGYPASRAARAPRGGQAARRSSGSQVPMVPVSVCLACPHQPPVPVRSASTAGSAVGSVGWRLRTRGWTQRHRLWAQSLRSRSSVSLMENSDWKYHPGSASDSFHCLLLWF